MRSSLVLSAVLLAATVFAAHAQQAPSGSEAIKRTPLQKFDVPGTSHETVIGLAEIAPPAGAVHDARSAGGGAKVIATYVVEKGKPLASPAP